MNEDELKVVVAMERRGGGFVKALAACFRRADLTNFQILRAAFPDYWKQYQVLAEKEPNRG